MHFADFPRCKINLQRWLQRHLLPVNLCHMPVKENHLINYGHLIPLFIFIFILHSPQLTKRQFHTDIVAPCCRKGSLKTKCPAVRDFFLNFCKIPFSNRLKYSISIKNNQNKAGFPAEWLCFLDESKLFPHKKIS